MGSPYKYDSSWKTEDFYTSDEIDALLLEYVELTGDVMTGPLTTTTLTTSDTGESTFNGAVRFNDVIKIGEDTTYFSFSGGILSLYITGELRQTWETSLATTAPVYIATGNPMGLLLGITYQL